MTAGYRPRPGDLVTLHGVACRFTTALIIHVHQISAWEGMVWLDIYEVDDAGVATDKRMAYVPLRNITLLRLAQSRAAGRARLLLAAGRNARPFVPKQRTKHNTGSTR